MRSNLLRLLTGVALAGLALVWWPAPAAAGRPCLPSGGCVTVHYAGDLTGKRGGHVQLRWRVVVTGTDVGGASLYFAAATGLAPQLGAVTVNGHPVTVNQPLPDRSDFTLSLPDLPVATAPATFLISYPAAVAPAANPELSASVDLSYADLTSTHFASGQPAVARLQVAFPDLTASTTGTDLWIPRGQDGDLFFGITNAHGEIDPPLVGVDITVSTGFAIGANPVPGATECHVVSSRHTHCTLPFRRPVVAGTILVHAAAATLPGTVGSAVVVTTPVGSTSDAHFADNTARMRLHVRGIADLREHWNVPAGGTVALDQPTTVSVTISNDGPDPATGLSGLIYASPGPHSTRADLRITNAAGTGPPTLGFSALPAHSRRTVPVVVTGLRAGATLTLYVQFSYPTFSATAGTVIGSYDPADAELPTTADLGVVDVGAASLPATGFGSIRPVLLLGASVLVLGLGLRRLGQRRRSR